MTLFGPLAVGCVWRHQHFHEAATICMSTVQRSNTRIDVSNKEHKLRSRTILKCCDLSQLAGKKKQLFWAPVAAQFDKAACETDAFGHKALYFLSVMPKSIKIYGEQNA